MKRLTTKDIEDILSIFDDLHPASPAELRSIIIENIKAPLREKLANARLKASSKYKIMRELARIYRPIEAGKSVGIITAQSVGEIQTQNNLNTFHRAGYRDSFIPHASRLQELTCTSKSKTQSSPMSMIYLKNESVVAREEMLKSISCMTFGEYIKSTVTSSTSNSLSWEKHFSDFYKVNLFEFEWRSTYTLDLNLLYRYQMTLEFIVDILKGKDLEVEFAFSPIHLGQICVYGNHLQELKTRVNKELFNTKLSGISGIKQAYFMPIKGTIDQVYIETEGTNLQEILYLPFVDTYNTISTDIWEIYDIFGIEAVREFLVEEFTNIMPAVHFSHIYLLVDRMTVSGKLRSITRYTRKNEVNASVLSKITFEETMKGFTDAAFKEQIDHVKGCSSSVICGKLPYVGTGMCDLLFEPPS